MKRTILVLGIIAVAFVAGRSSTQTTSNFNVRWVFTGVDAAAVDAAEIRYLASAVMGSGVDADIYQRDGAGVILLDGNGRKRIQANKVRPAFRSILEKLVQGWAEAGDVGELSGVQVNVIKSQVAAQPKPVVQ